jgi:hypothetical protein
LGAQKGNAVTDNDDEEAQLRAKTATGLKPGPKAEAGAKQKKLEGIGDWRWQRCRTGRAERRLRLEIPDNRWPEREMRKAI